MNRKTTLVAAVIAIATLVVPGVGAAQAGTGQEFGDHVSTCARVMGFHGDHNPGTHTGYAGWDGHACH
ncbi:hypothetical protein [Actinokineospora sp. HUAS TT18]|uniref:hypothetical protein n=1 Tax=Actinokineospora sp. HUAS TT18 TaxID=3447451 RepID=UPI003F5207EE